MMGFAWGVGGLATPFVGLLADRIGIEHTLTVMAGVPLVAAALAWPLPSGKRTAPHVNAGIVTPEPVRMDVAD
jgi:FSR family fosmidomycin resistance protein-like MFS transporter